MIIRKETKNDYNEVYQLVKAAFKTTSFSDGSEADYLNELRNKDTFIPELSLVAESDSKILGQITLTKLIISTKDKVLTELLLSPISVHPEHFNKGIASRLMKKSFDLAIEMGYSAIFLCGDHNFYTKRGFKPTYLYGIYHKKDVQRNADWCMVKELKKTALDQIEAIIDIV